MTLSELPANLKRAVISRTLGCSRCGYNLRGVRVDSACPECGLAVRSTVQIAIDPTASGLTQLKNPKTVGNSILWLTLCLLIIALLVSVPAGLKHFWFGGNVDVPWREVITSPSLLLGATGIAVLGILSCLGFMGRKGTDSEDQVVKRDIRLLCMGLILLAVVAAMNWYLLWLFENSNLPLPAWRAAVENGAVILGYAFGGLVTLTGTGGILRVIGERSRTYREAKGARQGIKAMNLATICIGIGGMFGMISSLLRIEWLNYPSIFIVVSSTLMVVIGLAYLVVNAWWIRSAIRRPPLRISQLIRIELDTTHVAEIERSRHPSGMVDPDANNLEPVTEDED